jgi:hypothetical protein
MPRACGTASLMARCATPDVGHPIQWMIVIYHSNPKRRSGNILLKHMQLMRSKDMKQSRYDWYRNGVMTVKKRANQNRQE